ESYPLPLHDALPISETTALEVLVANRIDVRVDAYADYVPTPALSHVIRRYNGSGPIERGGVNRGKGSGPGFADGIVITPSHNPRSEEHTSELQSREK